MPTKKPRLNLTLDPELAALLDRFAEVTGSSKASFVVSMLREAMPVMEGTIQAVEIARKNPAKSFDDFSDLLMANMVTAQQMRLELEKDRKKLSKTKNLGRGKKK